MSSQWRQPSPSSPARAVWPHAGYTISSEHTNSQYLYSFDTQIDIRTHLQSPEGLSLWRTRERLGAKDGWRQQQLVPGCRSVPEANPLISSLPCSAHPPAAAHRQHIHAQPWSKLDIKYKHTCATSAHIYTSTYKHGDTRKQFSTCLSHRQWPWRWLAVP